MKKLLYSLIIGLFSLTSCQTYEGISAGANGCGEWHPKKFEKDRRSQARIREIRVRNGWNKHY